MDGAPRFLVELKMRLGGVAFFAGVEGDGETVLLGRQGAGGEGGIGAGGILEAIEVEFEDSLLGEAVGGQAGMQVAGGCVGRRLAACVLKDEEEHVAVGIFDDWLESVSGAAEHELRLPGRRQIECGAEHGGDFSMRAEGKGSQRAWTLKWARGQTS